MIIYKITNLINNKIYIGQTMQQFKNRVREHLKHAKKGSDRVISKAIFKYGKENFLFEEIERVETLEELNERETHYINFYNCLAPNGYNICSGGGGTVGYKHTAETKAIMSSKKDGLFFGASNPFFGKTHSEEQIKKWSKERKGIIPSLASNIKRKEKSPRKPVIDLNNGLVFESARHFVRHHGKNPNSGLCGAVANVCNKKPKYKTVLGVKLEYYEPGLHDNTVSSLQFLKEDVTTI